VRLDRLSDITSELSSNLVKSIVFPTGFWEWLTRPLADRRRDRKAGSKSGEVAESGHGVATGPLVLIGGAPIPDEAVVALIHLVGGRSAAMAVVPVATRDPGRAAEEGVRGFTRFGMRKVEVLELTTREQAESEEWARRLSSFDGVLLCGEDPLVGLDILAGTRCARTLQEMMAAGKPVAGLAAGAAILGERLLVEQDGKETVVAGLGLAPSLMVDPYFTQRARFSRMAQALSQGGLGNLLGVGVDGGTAVVIRDEEARVLGEGSATFLSPEESVPVGDQGNGTPGAAELKVHVLTDGFGLNLRTRKPTAAVREPAEAAGNR